MPGSAEYRRSLAALFCYGMGAFTLLWCTQPLLVPISKTFSISASSSSWAVSASTIGIAAAIIPVEKLSVRYGRATALKAGLTLAALCTFVIAAAPSWPILLAARGLQGAGLAAIPVAAPAWVAEEIYAQAITRVGGFYIAATSLGGITGRLVSGFLTEWFSWRIGIACVAVISLTISTIGHILLPPAKRGPRNHLPDPSPIIPPPSPAKERRQRLIRIRLYLTGLLAMFTFVGIFNALAFRVSAPPFTMGTGVGSMFYLAYLSGTYTSARAGKIYGRVGMRGVMMIALTTWLIGIAVTLPANLITIWIGLILTSAGFFAIHAVASSQGPRYADNPSQASARYTLMYYLGATAGGVVFGGAWELGHWTAVAVLAATCLVFLAFGTIGLPGRPKRVA